MVAALGIAEDGRKMILGIRQGATENATVVGELLGDLLDRGLNFSLPRLYVLDGGKASDFQVNFGNVVTSGIAATAIVAALCSPPIAVTLAPMFSGAALARHLLKSVEVTETCTAFTIVTPRKPALLVERNSFRAGFPLRSTSAFSLL